jgi:hypothetical protein
LKGGITLFILRLLSHAREKPHNRVAEDDHDQRPEDNPEDGDHFLGDLFVAAVRRRLRDDRLRLLTFPNAILDTLPNLLDH